ncbi:hypothetical protein E6W17_32145 [Streptomyces sp. A1547]|nr:hypothetical protein E6W17_32145 [Streptomyces sp. A1547]
MQGPRRHAYIGGVAVGTLYGALQLLERSGWWVAADHEEIVDGRARRCHRLTEDGDGTVTPSTTRPALLSSPRPVRPAAMGSVG